MARTLLIAVVLSFPGAAGDRVPIVVPAEADSLEMETEIRSFADVPRDSRLVFG